MKNDFEFDKIVIAVALPIIILLVSGGLGGFIYRTERIVEKPGFAIEIVDASDAATAPKGLPDVIEIGKIMAQADASAGKAVYNKCAVCHTIGSGEANKVGPNLWGILGGAVTHKQDFTYSTAMVEKAKVIKKWGYEELYRYLYAPKAYVPGTKMAFAGIKNDKDRRDLIAYLRTMSASPIPLPAIEK
ncbi:MAG: c-type cytochrome [Alphaproteobacteria bacterium]|nr:cytochrome c family protein [Candidatus Jidaibacter sp.]